MNLILTDLRTEAGKAIATSGAGAVKDSRGLAWEVGQVLQGRVIGQRGTGYFILELEGREILARTPFFLSPGDLVSLQVQERQGSLYMVKLLSRAGLTTNDIPGEILARLGLKDTPLHRSLVQKFINHRLPLQQELLGQVKQALALLGSEDEEGIEVVLQALKLGVLPRTDALKLLQEFMLGEKDPGQAGMTRLARFIPLLADLIDGLAGERGKEARLLYQEFRTLVASLVLKPEEGEVKVAEQLRNLLSSQLPARDGVAPFKPLPSNGLIEKLDYLLQAIRDGTRQTGQDASGKLLETGKMIVRQLAGQLIFQWCGRDNELQSYLYFTLPLLKNNEVTNWGQLVIKKERRGNIPIDRQNFNISILVNTENLGCLLLEISIWQREVRVQGRVEKEWVGRLINESWPALQGAFARMGYHLHGYKWQPGIVPRCLIPWEMASGETSSQIGFLDKRV
ncbi:hypothetical protein [Neomoorella mulderi]|uniref:Flagellar hook-length control protein FliK n=1 Tax=Moorella mulderi DSM 14980 TaxID=1122241 RepID=A0A151AZI7_9FIRM|nr:hypothetical protein [Moorella mulderi]KYH32980.1 hypothetical protein MOMUL_07580 [Moorella mulderi DSM 14980]